ncbi:hypothetical protein C8J57DRAFT_1511861 [Mycena rebaudengoi]|nr:hypothetical protein C8J57DRAFT_1511861 [Mycena rebaudengoi]
MHAESWRQCLYLCVDSCLVHHHFLISLGPWESCAAALVLRAPSFSLSLHILSLIDSSSSHTAPSVSREEDHYYAGMSNEDDFLDAKEIFVVPPLYTFPVEKSEVADVAVVIENK